MVFGFCLCIAPSEVNMPKNNSECSIQLGCPCSETHNKHFNLEDFGTYVGNLKDILMRIKISQVPNPQVNKASV
jgi:hypothetical protein